MLWLIFLLFYMNGHRGSTLLLSIWARIHENGLRHKQLFLRLVMTNFLSRMILIKKAIRYFERGLISIHFCGRFFCTFVTQNTRLIWRALPIDGWRSLPTTWSHRIRLQWRQISIPLLTHIRHNQLLAPSALFLLSFRPFRKLMDFKLILLIERQILLIIINQLIWQKFKLRNGTCLL